MATTKIKRDFSPSMRAKFDNLFASAANNTISIDDVYTALVEIADMVSAQDDAIVELAEIIEEG